MSSHLCLSALITGWEEVRCSAYERSGDGSPRELRFLKPASADGEIGEGGSSESCSMASSCSMRQGKIQLWISLLRSKSLGGSHRGRVHVSYSFPDVVGVEWDRTQIFFGAYSSGTLVLPGVFHSPTLPPQPRAQSKFEYCRN